MIYSLKFTFNPINSSSLELGVLELFQGDKIINTIRAASSYPGKQYWGSWETKGGLIPPGEWEVSTDPLDMREVRGVNTGDTSVPSYFYQIHPEVQRQENGVMRGDFGVHFDGNAPGSLGCVVAQTLIGWLRIRQFFAAAKAAGQDKVKLVVLYNK